MDKSCLKIINDYIEKKCLRDNDFKAQVEKVRAIENCDDLLDNHLQTQASVYLERKSGLVKDETVFNWAFDFYHDFDFTKKQAPVKTVARNDSDLDYKNIVKPTKEPKEPKKEKPKEFEEVTLFDF